MIHFGVLKLINDWAINSVQYFIRASVIEAEVGHFNGQQNSRKQDTRGSTYREKNANAEVYDQIPNILTGKNW